MSSFNRLTKTEIAKCFGVTLPFISTWLKRGNLIADDDGMIDISDLRNAKHIEIQASKGKVFDISKLMNLPNSVVKSPLPASPKEEKIEKPAPVKKNKARTLSQPVNSSTGESLTELEQKKKKLDILKIQKAILLDELKIQKLEGSLIPFDAAKGLFLFVIENFNNAYIQGLEAQLNIFAQRFSATAEDLADLRKELISLIGDLKDEAQENSILGLDSIVDEYAEVRGRGERK